VVALGRLSVGWDCYLPGANVDCTLLATSLGSKVPFLRVVPGRLEADVVVTLRSLPAEDGTRFIFDFEGKPIEGYATAVHTTDRIPNSIDAVTASIRIMTKLERGLDDFMDQKVAAEARDGMLTLQLLDPVRLPYGGRPEQDGLHWYLTPSIGAYFSDVEGVGVNASGSASVTFNYSGARWRFQTWTGMGYSQQSQPVPGTSETATISFLGANANDVVSRSISQDGRWSVAFLMSVERNPQANYAFRANNSWGFEFDAIPRLTVNQKNFGFRCAAGPEFQRYDVTNTEGRDEQLVCREFCDLFLSWHFPSVDVGASLGETAILEKIQYRGFSGALSLTWRVTDNLVVSPWVSAQQINQAVNQFVPPSSFADARQEIEASMRAAIQQGYTAPFGIQSGVSIRYLFGNGSLNSEDQRWRTASNLR
jgi:hypothetical protein